MSTIKANNIKNSAKIVFGSIAASLVLATSSIGIANAHNGVDHSKVEYRVGLQTPAMGNLYAAMQKLWAEHMEWTYAAVTAYVSNPDAYEATASRLIQNQEDIGNAIKPFYGEDAGNALAKLLKEHIAAAVDVVVHAKDGNKQALDAAIVVAYDNAQEIADFLSSANDSWEQDAVRSMMKGHIDSTLVYATSIIQGNYAHGIESYGLAADHMLEMADALSAGLIAAFPDKFTN